MVRARKLCSKYAELYGPGVSTTAVVSPWATGDNRAQGVGEPGRVVIDAVDPGQIERAREDALGDDAVLDHVRHPRRVAQVVLEHAPGAVRIPDEIDAGDVDADAPAAGAS